MPRLPRALERLRTAAMSRFAPTERSVHTSRYDFDLRARPQVSARLWQHPVGQGLFHSGCIRFGDSVPFRYVYDCGKMGADRHVWADLISPMLHQYHARPLDALFVSHFDIDHINGLGPLLSAFGGANTCFLPYVHPARRLFLGVRESLRTSSTAVDYHDFLDDPARSLKSQGVRRVVYVGGPPPEEDGGPVVPPELPDRPRDLDRRIEGAAVLVMQTSETPLRSMDGAAEEAAAPRDWSNVSFMDHRFPVVVHVPSAALGEWVFQTYVDPDPETTALVCRIVRSKLGPKAFEDLVAGRLGCADILRDGKTRTMLKSAYRDALQKAPFAWRDVLVPGARQTSADRSVMNRGSMSLFSGPRVSQPRSVIQSIEGAVRGPSHVSDLLGRRPGGWLLTGDAVLRDKTVRRNFALFFGGPGRFPGSNYLAQVTAFTLPHHGSAGNFSEDALALLGRPPIAVVPAGRKTHYGHPSDSIMALLERAGVCISHVHEAHSIGLVHKIAVYG
jgi:hypothetical protein